jgi:60 kDa SS-A/Ro ribonucleoprotein
MPNSNIFTTQTPKGVATNAPAADTVNPAGGAAFAYGPKHRLAQLLMTGTGFDSFYQGGNEQLAALVDTVRQLNDAEYLAKAVVAGATLGFMKDLPLCGLVLLSKEDKQGDLFRAAFQKVVWDGRRLRTFCQLVKSKVLGRSCFTINKWLNEASVSKLINASIGGKAAEGGDMSLENILQVTRPFPPDNARRALYGWLLGRSPKKWAEGAHPCSLSDLPEEARLVRAYDTAETEDQQVEILRAMQERRAYVRWDRLSGNAKGNKIWHEFARTMAPQALRMNLNSMSEHGVFDDPDLTQLVIAKLTDAEEIRSGRQFPYQYFAAYKFLKESVPQSVRSALHKAAELCCGNVPKFPGPVAICVDVSSSMTAPVTGYQSRGQASKVTCVDAASVMATALYKANPDSVIIPFNNLAILPGQGGRYGTRFDPDDSMLSLAASLAALCSGGTDCHTALAAINEKYKGRPFAAVVYLSDNASWVTASVPSVSPGYGGWQTSNTTALMREWQTFCSGQRQLGRFPRPKMFCWDLAHYGSTQAPESEGIYNLGGFSDSVFSLMSSIAEDDRMRFVRMVEQTKVI